MGLPISEEALWAIYNFFEDIDEKWASSDFLLFLSNPKAAVFGNWNAAYQSIKNKFEKKQRREQFSHLIYRLKKSGWIKIKELENKQAIIFTPRGKGKILQIGIKQINKKRRRDKKWQMIIFDIPEKYRKQRDHLRDNLKILGYKKLQQSVWISPYDVLRETQILVRNFSVESYIRLLLVQEMELTKNGE